VAGRGLSGQVWRSARGHGVVHCGRRARCTRALSSRLRRRCGAAGRSERGSNQLPAPRCGPLQHQIAGRTADSPLSPRVCRSTQAGQAFTGSSIEAAGSCASSRDATSDRWALVRTGRETVFRAAASRRSPEMPGNGSRTPPDRRRFSSCGHRRRGGLRQGAGPQPAQSPAWVWPYSGWGWRPRCRQCGRHHPVLASDVADFQGLAAAQLEAGRLRAVTPPAIAVSGAG